jgi:hypothetical protein
MATTKKTTQKQKKATLKSTKKTKSSAKSVVKSSSKASAKKITKSKLEPKKAAKKVVKKVVDSKKTSSKKSEPKAKKGMLTKIVGKLTGSKPATKSVVKSTAKPAAKESKINLKKVEKVKAQPKVEAKATPAKTVEKATKVIKAPKVIDEALALKNSQKNIAELTQEFTDKKSASAEVLLTDAEGRVLCKYSGCDEIANVEGYCRYHYLLNWKRIQLKKKILSEGKLEKYINELTAKYPDKYVEMLKGDLKSEKDFLSVVNELEIDDSDNSMSDDEEDNYIEQEVQGVSGGGKRSNEEDY